MTGRRAFLAGALSLPIAAQARGAEQWDAVVDPATGTLGAALAEAEKAGRPWRILLKPGLFTEKLTVRVPNLNLQGSPGTVIEYGTASGTPKPGGGSWGTGGSATLTIAAPGVTLRELIVINSFDYIGARRDGSGNGAQAVALAIGREADRTIVDRCTLIGYQDTFYVQARSLVTGTRITGGVDSSSAAARPGSSAARSSPAMCRIPTASVMSPRRARPPRRNSGWSSPIAACSAKTACPSVRRGSAAPGAPVATWR